MKHPLATYSFAARLTLLIQSGATVSLAWASPESLTARLVQAGGDDAQWALWIFTAVVVSALIDLGINDLAPRKFTAEPFRKRRHLIYSAIGACYCASAFANVSPPNNIPGSEILLWVYVAFGACAMWYSTVCALKGSNDAQ
jgi:hypothetical protein